MTPIKHAELVDLPKDPTIPTIEPVVIAVPAPSWRGSTLYQLDRPLRVGDYVVPRGFVSDGISSPRLTWIVFPPTGQFFAESFKHDHLIETTGDRRLADYTFVRDIRNKRVGAFEQWCQTDAPPPDGVPDDEISDFLYRSWWRVDDEQKRRYGIPIARWRAAIVFLGTRIWHLGQGHV